MRIVFCAAWCVCFMQTLMVSAVQERITSFVSDIVVNTDASLTVTEEITVVSRGDFIRHGIVREFPTRYADVWGIQVVVPFTVTQVLHNGQQTHYAVRAVANGKKIYIGASSELLPAGIHTYRISYTTKRQLGFFADHDELYWNVTGNGWRLPIQQVQATVHLPESTAVRAVKAYTGFQGERGSDYVATVEPSVATFATMRPLAEYEGLTLVVTWPKGVVHEPGIFQKISWFLHDNWVLIVLLCALFYACVLALQCWLAARYANKPGVVIPLFYPPDGLMPSDVGYMKKRGWQHSFLAADIVDYAVRELLTIEYKKSFWGRGEYTLTTTEKYTASTTLSKRDEAVLKRLFATHPSIVIAQSNREYLVATLSLVKMRCASAVGQYIASLDYFTFQVWGLFIFVLLLALLPAAMGLQQVGAVHALAPFLAGIPLFIVHLKQRVYTSAGRKLQDEIDGFRMYLETAELERMKVIGTPPTKTPELYEKYLPYAMALGVEEQWSRQFASLFERLEREGHPYVPIWYHGQRLSSKMFASQFGQSFNAAIASATIAPGKSSGMGSGGVSGGGGGGGGGGW